MPPAIKPPFFGVFVVLCLCGCPYKASVPLGPVEHSRIDEQLTGEWRYTDPNTHEGGSLSFYVLSTHEYLVIMQDEHSPKLEVYRAFATRIENHTFLNYHDVTYTQENHVSYGFAHYEIHEDALYLKIVEDTLLPKNIDSSETLQTLFKKNLSQETFMDSLPPLKRMQEKDN